MAITWKKNTLFQGIEDAKKLLEQREGRALRRGIEVMKATFGPAGMIPVVSGRLKGSLLGRVAVQEKTIASKEGDILEKYESKGGEKYVIWGTNVEYAEDVELYSPKSKGFFTRGWNAGIPNAKNAIETAMNLGDKKTDVKTELLRP